MEEQKLVDMPIRCPEKLQVSWVEIPPYVYNATNGQISGVFRGILSDMVQYCCKGKTAVNYSAEVPSFNKFQELLQNGSGDVFLPVYGSDKKKYILGNPFISIVESPGIAFFYGRSSSSQSAIVNSFLASCPVLAIILVSALIIGTSFWLMEIVRNSASEGSNTKSNQRSVILKKIRGPWDGFYWALVTMTTVGYGDFYPKSVGGRFLAIFWILFGTAILSMFTASITTGLLAACLSNEVSLAGSTVGVIANSKESNIATVKNAIGVEFPNIEDLAAVLSNGRTDGVLLDSYVAGHYQSLFEKFLLAEVIEYVFTYGIVLRNKGLWMEKCLRLYPQIYRNDLFRTISSSIIPFKPLKFGNQATSKSANLIDFSSGAMQTFLIILGSLLCLLIVAGFIREKYFLNKNINNNTSASGRTKLALYEESLQIQQRKHTNETYAAFRDMQNELETLNSSLTKMLKTASDVDVFEKVTETFENGNKGNHFKNSS